MNQEEKEHFLGMVIDLQAVEDDMTANTAPVEAIRLVQRAVLLCRNEYKRRFSEVKK